LSTNFNDIIIYVLIIQIIYHFLFYYYIVGLTNICNPGDDILHSKLKVQKMIQWDLHRKKNWPPVKSIIKVKYLLFLIIIMKNVFLFSLYRFYFYLFYYYLI